MTSPRSHARRRYLSSNPPTTSILPSLNTQIVCLDGHASPNTARSLRKSLTFASPTSPPSEDEDPILSIPLLPKRSPTCPKDLQDAVAAGEKRAAYLLGVVDRSLSGLRDFSTDSQDTQLAEDLPLPRFMVHPHAADVDDMDIDPSAGQSDHAAAFPKAPRKHHTSDSGIGSTITDSKDSMVGYDTARKENMHDKASPRIREVQSGINGSVSSFASTKLGTQHMLGEYACKQIHQHIILPILRASSLKDFHPLITGIPYRVRRKEITCLRDLEKVLLWLAPKWSVSKASFINFCETSIQCIHTTVDYLSESDQRRPTDRPYTNGYFLDLTEQVRQYAAMMSASRERMAAGGAPTDDDCTADESLALHGGLSQNGRPAELVRIKNGRSISVRTGQDIEPEASSTAQARSESTGMDCEDDDIMRSMGRRKKSAHAAKDVQQCDQCERVFKRPCDLTKHEKTHSRPWKCSESSCKYYQYGWPTEKERDRHVNDKHSMTPAMFKCQFHPCPYKSKRESNCKQHMEKAHGWAYIRSKNNGKTAKKAPSTRPPSTPPMATPGSHIFDISSPELGEAASPVNPYNGYNAVQSLAGPTAASEPSDPQSALESPFLPLSEIFGPVNPDLPWNDLYNNDLTLAGPSEYTPSSHRLSWDQGSLIANPSTVPSSFESSLIPPTSDLVFSDNFNWSNLNPDFTSYNTQLITPACSVDNKPLNAFSRDPSASMEHSPGSHLSSLSPGAQGNVMLYSPRSNEDFIKDEGYDEFTSDAGKPSMDFPLYDGSSRVHLGINGSEGGQFFQDLATIVPINWSGHGAELAQQLEMNDLMQVDED